MSQLFRICMAILTLCFTLGLLVAAGFALTIPHVGMCVICLIMSVGFGYFSYRDAKYFFGKK